jgi:hypothetical protein
MMTGNNAAGVLTYRIYLRRRCLLPVVWNFQSAFQAEMPFDESANKAVIFVLQTDAE